MVRMFVTKHLGYKIDSDSKHIPIRAFGYEATKIERNMIMEKKYFANLEYREVNGVLVPDIELPEEYENCASEITSKTECEIFIDGFQLGMRLALELLEM